MSLNEKRTYWNAGLKLIREIYFLDGDCHIQGVYSGFTSGGKIIERTQLKNSAHHGESKTWGRYGILFSWGYFVNGKKVHDFLKNPISDEEKVLLVLKYGAPLLPNVIL